MKTTTTAIKLAAFDLVRDIVKLKSLEALDIVSDAVKLALELEASAEIETPVTPKAVVVPKAVKAAKEAAKATPKAAEAPKAVKAPKATPKAAEAPKAVKAPKATPKAAVADYDTKGKALELEAMCEEWLGCYYSGHMEEAPKVTGMMCRYRALKKRAALTETINGWFAVYSQFKADKKSSNKAQSPKGRRGRPRKNSDSVPTQAQVDRQVNKAKSALTKTGSNIGPKNSRSKLSAEEKMSAASNKANRQQAKAVVAATKQQLSKQQATLYAAALLQLEAYAVELGFEADIASTSQGLQALHVEAYGKGHEACLTVLDSVYSLNELAKPAKQKVAQAERLAKFGKANDLDRVKALLA